MKPVARKTGWWNPNPALSISKFHYAGANGRSLCGKWVFVGRGFIADHPDNHPDNCAACQLKKLALDETFRKEP